MRTKVAARTHPVAAQACGVAAWTHRMVACTRACGLRPAACAHGVAGLQGCMVAGSLLGLQGCRLATGSGVALTSPVAASGVRLAHPRQGAVDVGISEARRQRVVALFGRLG